MYFRIKAPLRISLAGGGTDVSPYSELYGGAILNTTLNMYAYATIEPTTDKTVRFDLADLGKSCSFPWDGTFSYENEFSLHYGVYKGICNHFHLQPLSFRLTTSVDAPPGSGLGTSSTLVVAILGAFTEWLKLPLGEYDLARLAYQIERIDLGMSGGKQDQYSATFGGVNFMEFSQDDNVIVNPLRIKDTYLKELANNLLLYNTSTSRLSAKIIEAQQHNVRNGNQKSIEAMHEIKKQAYMMKDALLRGRLDDIGEILDFGWRYKKQMAEGISNPRLDEIYETAIKNGALGGKISGAGGGGFMFFYCPGNSRHQVAKALQVFGGQIQPYEFTAHGMLSWSH